jgi:chromosome segregation ATPase
MLRLQVEKLSEQVSQKSDELVSLENRRQQLQLSMEERVFEIDAHLGALRTQLKTEEEARHVAAIELQERKRRAETLQSKYEVTMGKYKIEGEEVSQTYHVIKFAQEREHVNARGDELQEEVRIAIAELRAIEREVQKLNGANSDFRASFSAVGKDDTDAERKKVLEEQVRVAQQRLNARRAEAHTVSEERSRMEQTYEQQQAKITQMQDEIAKMKPQIERISGENRDLTEKIKRATHMLGRAREGHRKSNNIALEAKYPASLLEMDVELRMIKSGLDAAIAELTRLAEGNRDIEPPLRTGLNQIGIVLKQLGPTIAQPKSPLIVTPKSSGRTSGGLASSRSNGSQGSIGSRPSIQNLQFPK